MIVLVAKTVLNILTYIDRNEAGILFFLTVVSRSSETKYGKSSVFSKVRTVWSVGTDQRKSDKGIVYWLLVYLYMEYEKLTITCIFSTMIESSVFMHVLGIFVL